MNSRATNNEVDAGGVAQRISEAAERARGSELKLQGEVDALLREALRHYGIDYDPEVNQSLARSHAVTGRPDSLFGHVVLDYKSPGVLSSASAVATAKKQVADDYLTPICSPGGSFDPEEAKKWVGVLLDGEHIAFATYDGVAGWTWTPIRPVSPHSVLSLLQYYRALYRKPLDPYLLSSDFGRETRVAVQCIRELARILTEQPTTRTSMLFREWRRMFEQVSTYELDQLPTLAAWARRHHIPGRDTPSLLLFTLHTYYAFVVKLLTAELLTANRQFGLGSFVEELGHAATREELAARLETLETGRKFQDLGIRNFLEGDFFSWYVPHIDAPLEAALREVIRKFSDYEPATPKLNPERCKDLLKVFYTGVVDEQIRHDLGEYYTPDWLAELVLNRVGYEGEIDAKVLDTTCGSGTFLVVAIQRLCRQLRQQGAPSAEIVQRVITQITGFDLNPLAVVSARANVILLLLDYLGEYGGDVEIPVYLCDAINVPVQREIDGCPCLVYTLDTELGEKQVALPEVLVRAGVIPKVLRVAESYVTNHGDSEGFLSAVRADTTLTQYLDRDGEDRLRAFYYTISQLEEREWDRIWCGIVKNHFASQAVGQVEFIVGNPPWVRWSRLPRRYRERCKEFCNYYGLVSGRGYAGGIESDISTVVAFSSADHWLRPGGVLGLLITATVWKSDSAAGFRKFRLPASEGVALYPYHIDDLIDLQPFPDAANETSLFCVRKGMRPSEESLYPQGGIAWLEWNRREGVGRIDPRLTLDQVEAKTHRVQKLALPVAEEGSPLFVGTEEEIEEVHPLRGRSDEYLQRSHKGTTTDLSRVYWVKLLGHDPVHRRARIRTLREEELAGAKKVDGTAGFWIENSLLYPLIRGRDVGRYCYSYSGLYIIVPNLHYEEMETEQEFRQHYPRAYEYFSRNRDLLLKRSTYRRYQRGRPFYAIYDVGAYTFSSYKVVWLEQQDPIQFRAAVVGQLADSLVPNQVIVPDHKLYMFSTKSEDEAHYVCAVLNSRPLRLILGGFLTTKQIGTSVFRYSRVPTFDPSNQPHMQIARISRRAHAARVGTHAKGELPEEEERLLEQLVLTAFREAH